MAFMATIVSMRARWMPRHMCTPLAKAMWGTCSRKMSNSSGSSQRVSSWLAEPMLMTTVSPGVQLLVGQLHGRRSPCA